MKKLSLVVVCLALFGIGCTTVNHNVTNKIDATNVNFTTMQKGEDCKYFALGVLPLTNKDIDVAAKKANIKKLKYVEHSFSYYVLYSKSCVVVYGE